MPSKKRPRARNPKPIPRPSAGPLPPARGTPSITLLLYRAMHQSKPDFRGLSKALQAITHQPFRPVDAGVLLKRFKKAWRIRELQNEGMSAHAIASSLRMHRTQVSIITNDPRYHLPPRAPRMSIAEIAKKLNVSEKEIREWLDWKPEK